MRVPKNKQCYFENHVVREPCKRRTVCTFKINKRVRHIEICIVICSLFLYSVFIFTSVYTAKTLLCCSKLGAQSILAEFQTLNLIMIKNPKLDLKQHIHFTQSGTQVIQTGRSSISTITLHSTKNLKGGALRHRIFFLIDA